MRVLREGCPRVLLHAALEYARNLLPVLRRQVGICGARVVQLVVAQGVFKILVRHAKHHRTEHLHQPTVAVVDEMGIVFALRHALCDFVVQA